MLESVWPKLSETLPRRQDSKKGVELNKSCQGTIDAIHHHSPSIGLCHPLFRKSVPQNDRLHAEKYLRKRFRLEKPAAPRDAHLRAALLPQSSAP